MKMTKHPLGTLVETDVLVIGSGASGCGAALGARDQGLDVVLMDKGKLESSGCIGGGNDHYMAVLDEPGEAHDTVEDLINKSEDDMMKVRNLGRKSLEEVINKLASLGFGLYDEEE